MAHTLGIGEQSERARQKVTCALSPVQSAHSSQATMLTDSRKL